MTSYPLNFEGGQYYVRQATESDVQRIAEIWLEGAQTAFGSAASGSIVEEDVQIQVLRLVLQQNEHFKFWMCLDQKGESVGWSTVQPFHTSPLQRMRNSYGLISTYMSNGHRGKGLEPVS